MSYQILIIGGGASGLMAASKLAAHGHTVTVLEARERTGGRINTLQNKFSIPAEAGAEFMHGEQPLTRKLIAESKSESSELAGKWFRLKNGKLQESDFFNDEWKLLTKALGKLTTDTDMATFLDLHFKDDKFRDLRDNVKNFVEGYDAADTRRVSALALKKEWSENDDDKQHHIVGGYGRIIQHLETQFKSAGGSINFSSPVAEIKWSAGKVAVRTSDGKVHDGEKIVITAPLGVLQKGSIGFVPRLPDHEKAFQAMGFGGVIKFLFEFSQPFWQSNQRSFRDLAFLLSDATVPTWWTQLPDKTPLLTGWLGGPRTFDETHRGEVLFEKAIDSLRYIFNCSASELRGEIKQWHIADWVKDPYACGAYTYPTVEAGRIGASLFDPVKNTLYFAGEAFYNGPAMGTVEAALVNGSETADKIIDAAS